MIRAEDFLIAPHFRILGWIHVGVSGLLLLAGLAVLVDAALEHAQYPNALPFVMGMFFSLGVVVLLPSFIGGIGLLKRKQWGRLIIIIVSVEFLLAFPVGTALGGYGLWALLKQPGPLTQSGAAASGLVTCPHLQRFEGAIRGAGIAVYPVAERTVKGENVRADCRIHRWNLERQFGPIEPLRYEEYWSPDCPGQDIPVARLWCRQCACQVFALHPAEYHLDMRWFPAAPRELRLEGERVLEPRSEVTRIAMSPSGRLAAVAAGTYTTPEQIAIWDTGRRKIVRPLAVHGVIRAMAWMPDEKTLVTGRGLLWTGGQGSQGASIFVWDAATGKEVLRFGDELFGVHGIAISPDGKTLAASGMLGQTFAEGSTVDLWELSSGRRIARLAKVEAHAHDTMPYFTSVAFTTDGAMVLAGCGRYNLPASLRVMERTEMPAWWRRTLRMWRVSDGQDAEAIEHYAPVKEMRIAPDERRLFCGGSGLRMWDPASRALIWEQPHGYGFASGSSADCRWVARGMGEQVDNHGPFVDTAVQLYDGGTGELLAMGRHRTTPTAIAIGPDGLLIAGGVEGELKFWRG